MFRTFAMTTGTTAVGALGGTTIATAQPITAEPVGVAVPSSTDLINTGIYGSSQLITPGGFWYGLQVIADLIPLTFYSVSAQLLAFIPVDQIVNFS